MKNIKITIEYDGTHFKGWQIQKKGERTVQGELKKAVQIIFKQNTSVIGSGRTDTGVHAKGQVANFKVKTCKDVNEITQALNGNLPKDISIIETKFANESFHAQYSAKSKTYIYTILNRKQRSALHHTNSLFYPHSLNISKMRAESKTLIGKHDFKSFQASDPSKKNKNNTVRTIKRLEIKKRGDFIFIEIESNGFLYKMVRNIVGTLIEIGRGKLEKGAMKKILNKKDRSAAAYTAKPHGLILCQVRY